MRGPVYSADGGFISWSSLAFLALTAKIALSWLRSRIVSENSQLSSHKLYFRLVSQQVEWIGGLAGCLQEVGSEGAFWLLFDFAHDENERVLVRLKYCE